MEGMKRRVQLLSDHFVTKEQRLKGVRGIMVTMHANRNTVSEFIQDICDLLGLRCTSSHGPILKLDRYIIPGCQPTSIFRDLDQIRVEGDFIKERKKQAVATEKEKKEVRKRPLPEETGLKREQKDTSPKNKRVASINNSTSTGFRSGPKGKDPSSAAPPAFHHASPSATGGESHDVLLTDLHNFGPAKSVLSVADGAVPQLWPQSDQAREPNSVESKQSVLQVPKKHNVDL